MDGDGVERTDELGKGQRLGGWGDVVQGEDGFEVCEERGGDVGGVCGEVDWEVER